MEMLIHSNFRKVQIHIIVKTNRRLFYVVHKENFMAYKVIRNYWDKHTTLKHSSIPHFSKTMKNLYILTQCLNDMSFYFLQNRHNLFSVGRTHQRLQNDTKTSGIILLRFQFSPCHTFNKKKPTR